MHERGRSGCVALRDRGCWRGVSPRVSLEVVGQGVPGGPDRECVGWCCWRVSPQNLTTSRKQGNRYLPMLFGVYACIILLWLLVSSQKHPSSKSFAGRHAPAGSFWRLAGLQRRAPPECHKRSLKLLENNKKQNHHRKEASCGRSAPNP